MAKYRFDQVARECRTTFKGDKNGMPIVGLEHLVPNEMLVRDFEVDTENTFTKSFKQGQILFGRRRAYQQKAGVAQFDGICSGDITVIEAIPGKIEPNLLPFIVQNEQFFEHAVQGSAGSLSPRVKWEHLASYEIELPTMEKQRVLADKLWTAYRLKESYKKLLAATDEMVKSQFIEMFYNDNFTCEKLKAHIEVIRGVSYKPTDVRDAKDKDSSVILRSNNIFNGLINYDDIVFVDSTRVSEAQELSKGDIVMCGSNGSKNLVGKAAMITEPPLHKTSFGAFCLGIRCKDTIHPMYLSSYFQTSIYRNKIEELGAGSNILNIKPDYINNMEIPVPRIEQQLKFVSIAEQADKSKFVGFKSQFIEMFGKGNWEQKCLGEIGTFKRGGGFQKSDYVEHGIPCIHYGQIHTKFGPFIYSHITEISTDLEPKTKFASKGDLIIAITSEDTEGSCKSTAWLGDYPVAVGGHAAIFHHCMNPLYMSFFFKSTLFNYAKMEYIHGTKVFEVKPDDIAKILVPCPPMSLQKQFSVIARQADKSKLLHRKSIKYSKYSL